MPFIHKWTKQERTLWLTLETLCDFMSIIVPQCDSLWLCLIYLSMTSAFCLCMNPFNSVISMTSYIATTCASVWVSWTICYFFRLIIHVTLPYKICLCVTLNKSFCLVTNSLWLRVTLGNTLWLYLILFDLLLLKVSIWWSVWLCSYQCASE